MLVQVAADEASHFQQLQQRLHAIGSHYGALPVHDGLWESAAATALSLPARLAVESCVHEARGLDRLPHNIRRFQNAGDAESAQLLEKIYQVLKAVVRFVLYWECLSNMAQLSSEDRKRSYDKVVAVLQAGHVKSGPQTSLFEEEACFDNPKQFFSSCWILHIKPFHCNPAWTSSSMTVPCICSCGISMWKFQPCSQQW